MKHSQETIDKRDGYVSAALEVWDSIIPMNKTDARLLAAHSWTMGFQYGRQVARRKASKAASRKRTEQSA